SRSRCRRFSATVTVQGGPEITQRRKALISAQASSTSTEGMRIGRSVPAARNAVSCSRHWDSGPSKQTASSSRSLSAAPPAPLSMIHLGTETARAEESLGKRESCEHGEIAPSHLHFGAKSRGTSTESLRAGAA